MSAELTPEVIDRLTSDQYGWLTTVAKSGQPVPRLIWFYFDGVALYVYSAPHAAKDGHVKRHPQVSMNVDSDGYGGGIVVIGGEATIDAEGVYCREDAPYWWQVRPGRRPVRVDRGDGELQHPPSHQHR